MTFSPVAEVAANGYVEVQRTTGHAADISGEHGTGTSRQVRDRTVHLLGDGLGAIAGGDGDVLHLTATDQVDGARGDARSGRGARYAGDGTRAVAADLVRTDGAGRGILQADVNGLVGVGTDLG